LLARLCASELPRRTASWQVRIPWSSARPILAAALAAEAQATVRLSRAMETSPAEAGRARAAAKAAAEITENDLRMKHSPRCHGGAT
jgi:hypothetical protein